VHAKFRTAYEGASGIGIGVGIDYGENVRAYEYFGGISGVMGQRGVRRGEVNAIHYTIPVLVASRGYACVQGVYTRVRGLPVVPYRQGELERPYSGEAGGVKEPVVCKVNEIGSVVVSKLALTCFTSSHT